MEYDLHTLFVAGNLFRFEALTIRLRRMINKISADVPPFQLRCERWSVDHRVHVQSWRTVDGKI